MATTQDQPSSSRRTPKQKRSRERVERILDAAAELVTRDGPETLTTRACAERAGIPIASLYQYFADKEEILVALLKRHTAEFDAAVVDAIGGLRRLSVRTLVEATMNAYVEVLRRRSDIAAVWWRGRSIGAVMDYCRGHYESMAKTLHGLFVHAGVLRPDTDPIVGEIAIQTGDRVFELAFKDDLLGDPQVLAEGIELMVAYLRRYATPAGLEGIDQTDTVGRQPT